MKRVKMILNLLAVLSMLSLLTACGGQYESRPCTYNITACTPPPAWTCCSRWGYPYDEGTMGERWE